LRLEKRLENSERTVGQARSLFLEELADRLESSKLQSCAVGTNVEGGAFTVASGMIQRFWPKADILLALTNVRFRG
jgi:hypothetical protein